MSENFVELRIVGDSADFVSRAAQAMGQGAVLTYVEGAGLSGSEKGRLQAIEDCNREILEKLRESEAAGVAFQEDVERRIREQALRLEEGFAASVDELAKTLTAKLRTLRDLRPPAKKGKKKVARGSRSR